MTTINLHYQVMDVQTAADQAINFLMNGIANAITTSGEAHVEAVDGIWGVFAPINDTEMEWSTSTVTEEMVSVDTLAEAFTSKGWVVLVSPVGVIIGYPEITTIVEGDPDE